MGILREPAAFVKKLPLPAGFSVCELGDQWLTYTAPHMLAADWYRERGCGRYESIDGNGKGTLTADLNEPLDRGIGQFDLVTDFGTGEHIFDQAQVWRTIHALTKAGGFIAFDRPSQGYPEHCFYNVHECLFRDLAEANGYEVLRLVRGETSRGELIRGVFRKIGDEPFQVPQQGRYRKALKGIMPC